MPAVNLSPVGGAAAQFFTNNGVVLTGGKLYTYLAGTTTPATTYTTSAGNVTRTNPIVLDAAGRVPGGGEIWLTQGVVYKFTLTDSSDVLIATYDNISGISGLTLPIDSSNITYDPPFTNGVATNVETKLAQTVSIVDFGADPTGVASSSTAIQNAINAVGVLGSIIYPEGTYKVSSTISLLTQQHHIGFNATIVVDSGVTAFSRTTSGFPGRIKFSDLRFEGTGNTGKAISITNNTPFVQLENCYFEDFSRAVELSGSYCSNFSSCYFSYNLYGVLLLNECHSTQLINCFFDGNTYAGLAINGTPTDGNLGAEVHNITSLGCAYQNSEFGVWVESCYEFAAYSTYHEGNTKADMRLGVGDAGTYARFCYSFTIDSWQSSSPCASGKNIIMEHAVGGSLRGLAFNSGCSTTATLIEVDGFSDKISIDYHRFTTVTPTATAPFNFVGSAASRVAVFNDGRALYPRSMTSAIRFGTMASQPEGVYSGSVPSSGRPALYLESVGTDQDMVIKVTDIERHFDASNTLGFAVDHLNNQVLSGYQLRPSADNTVSLGASGARWTEVFAANGTINTSDEREKDLIEEVPQAWLDAWADVKYARFKFKEAIEKKGGGARWHVGLVAQRVHQAFAARGINAFEIGLLCYDEWSETTDVDGKTTPAGNRYGVRYEQALALECAYLRYKLGV